MKSRKCTRCLALTDEPGEFAKCSACKVLIASEQAAIKAAEEAAAAASLWRARSSSVAQYGLDYDSTVAMHVEQGGRCAGCRKHVRIAGLGVGERAHIDHCHRTGVVRGLLCRRCNAWLGRINDDAAWLERLAAYLRRGEVLALDPNHPRGPIDALRPPASP
jgi:hypothetical protein